MVFACVGSTTTSVMRPPMLLPPAYCQEPPVAVMLAACFAARAKTALLTALRPPRCFVRSAPAGVCGPPDAASGSDATTPTRDATRSDDEKPITPATAASAAIAASPTRTTLLLIPQDPLEFALE